MPPETETETETEPSLRDDIESAIEQVEHEFSSSAQSDPTAGSRPTQPTSAETPSSSASSSGSTVATPDGEDTSSADDSGASAAQADTSERARDPETGRFVADTHHPDDESRYPTLTTDRLERAPEGWRPSAREGWKDLPEAARREIHRRELDIATGMQEAAEARQFSNEFRALVDPYRALMVQEGARDPLDAIGGLLKTAATLRVGTPQEKADQVGHLVMHYGVDLKALDENLTERISNGNTAPPVHRPNGAGTPPAASTGDPALDQRLQSIEQFVGGLQSRLESSQQEGLSVAVQEVEDFARNAEFLDDVRLDMADLLEMAAARGRTMTVEQAYETACQMNPEIKALVAKRTQSESATATAQATRAKLELADASPRGDRPGGPMPGVRRESTGNLRQDIEAAIDYLESDHI